MLSLRCFLWRDVVFLVCLVHVLDGRVMIDV